MRRTDREITDAEKITQIIQTCHCCRLGFCDNGAVYIVPLNFGFDYEYDEATGKLTLWFHSAPRGRKLDAIRAAAGGRLPVAFTMQTDCEVVAGRTTCNWGETFKSIVGNGTASLVEDLDECRHGLQTLMAQQAHMPNVEFTDAQVRSVTVWKIESDYFTTKVRAKPAPAHMHQHPAVPRAGVIGAR